MKRLIPVLALLVLATFSAGAQNNAYSIDDECYKWFAEAEQSVNDFETDTFETAHQNLLESALRKKDTKAQNLYYVEQLKRTSNLAQYTRRQDDLAWDNQSWNARMEQDKETAQRIAKATGYMQYYYYASELCQTYYFNTSQDIAAGEMLVASMKEARESGDEYGMWKTLIYLGRLYIRISDKYNAQKYFLQAVRIHESTSDPTILRQSIVNQLCDLTDTYPVASVSARLFYRKAELGMSTRQDTMRVAYYKAQLAAWDGNMSEYSLNRDKCMSFPAFASIFRGGNQFFDCIDKILAGRPAGSFRSSIEGLYLHQQYVFTSSLAAHAGQWETSSAILVRFVDQLYSDISSINRQRLDHMSAEYDNNRLSADLAEASRRITRTTIWIAVLVTVILLGALLVALRHLRELKKKAKD